MFMFMPFHDSRRAIISYIPFGSYESDICPTSLLLKIRHVRLACIWNYYSMLDTVSSRKCWLCCLCYRDHRSDLRPFILLHVCLITPPTLFRPKYAPLLGFILHEVAWTHWPVRIILMPKRRGIESDLTETPDELESMTLTKIPPGLAKI